jgi:uncharacterized membrane protein YbhN (UPF0104 family)
VFPGGIGSFELMLIVLLLLVIAGAITINHLTRNR